MTVFLPNFIEGDLPSSLGIGEESESSDSPWWDFYRLTQHGLETGAGTRAEIRAELSVLQDDLFDFAYDVAKEARQIIATGDEDAASGLLTKYMAENAQRVISKVKSMIPATSTLG
jgi:hypothetical protein